MVAKSGKVKLSIYNALGQVEEVLVDCEVKIGVHEKVLSRHIANGVYFVRFATENRAITKNLVVIE